jgi:hypothetical protein
VAVIVAVHAEWYDDMRAGAYTIALDGGVGEAFTIESWVSNEAEAWVYATMQGLLAARERVPSVEGHELLVIGDRPDLSQVVRRAYTGRLGDAVAIRDAKFPGVTYRCRRFVDRKRLRSILRELVVTTKASEEAA